MAKLDRSDGVNDIKQDVIDRLSIKPDEYRLGAKVE